MTRDLLEKNGVTARYQAQGLAAVTDALAQNGPIAPAAYFPTATPTPTARRATR